MTGIVYIFLILLQICSNYHNFQQIPPGFHVSEYSTDMAAEVILRVMLAFHETLSGGPHTISRTSKGFQRLLLLLVFSPLRQPQHFSVSEEKQMLITFISNSFFFHFSSVTTFMFRLQNSLPTALSPSIILASSLSSSENCTLSFPYTYYP